MQTHAPLFSFVKILFILVVLCLLVGCNATPVSTPTRAPAAASTGSAPQPATRRLTLWHNWDGQQLRALQTVVRLFSAAHPNVQIDVVRKDVLRDALAEAVPLREGPDIVAWDSQQLGTLAQDALIVNLDEFGLNQAALAKHVVQPAAVGMAWNGQTWGTPLMQDGLALVFNKASASEADFPANPLDLNALLEKAEQFAAKNAGKNLICNTGFGNADAYHVAPIFFGFGLPAYVNEAGDAQLDKPAALQAVQWLQKIRPVSPATATYETCRDALLAGQVAAWWTDFAAASALAQAGTNLGVVAAGRPFVFLPTLMLTPNAIERKNMSIAINFFNESIAPASQTAMLDSAAVVPVSLDALKTNAAPANALWLAFADAFAQGVPMSTTPYADAQWNIVGDAALAVWEGAAPEPTLKSAQATFDAAVAQLKQRVEP